MPDRREKIVKGCLDTGDCPYRRLSPCLAPPPPPLRRRKRETAERVDHGDHKMGRKAKQKQKGIVSYKFLN